MVRRIIEAVIAAGGKSAAATASSAAVSEGRGLRLDLIDVLIHNRNTACRKTPYAIAYRHHRHWRG